MSTETLLPGLDATTGRVTVASVARTLTRERLFTIAREVGVEVKPSWNKAALAAELERSRTHLAEILGRLMRSELRDALEAHELDATGRSRGELADRLIEQSNAAPLPLAAIEDDPQAPRKGRLALVRQREYLITGVEPPPETRHATAARPAERVRLVCLDDDAQGRELEVLWPLELGARVIHPAADGLGEVRRFDRPAELGAYLNTLRWGGVSATDNALFQAPFRAGIQLMDHQIPPLSKALSLPRANLFIADDVGLGKTIEAGLVLQELILRQQVEHVLIVTPAAITLQWRTEMERRFGQRFEIMNRAFVARRRRERGFGVNPWSTHSRFIVSYHTLRRPEYLEPLHAQLDVQARRSLLILDEAHTVAPATSSRYAVDSNVTRVVRDLARRFDNRLFLSATPHNGHSNSFSALLEILDPARFTRGVPVTDPEALSPVMIRRLKSDLKALGKPYPDRRVIRVALQGTGDGWTATWQGDGAPAAHAIGRGHDAELRLAELLARYTELAEPRQKKGRLVFVSLQKRLLSSLEAFHRTLRAHRRWLEENPPDESERDQAELDLDLDGADPEVHGPSDDQLDAEDAAAVEAGSRDLEPPSEACRRLLAEMAELTERYRNAPSPKVLALREWLGRHCCPMAAPPGFRPEKPTADERRWSDRRVIIFTEYGDTRRYLREQLREAISGSDQAELRIVEIKGGMGDERRDEIQAAFNDSKSPVRILLATDAAREGVNLHGACADLFHFDIPWNPARLEQRNGRIDRTGQSSAEVRCHYLTYPERAEDRVLDVLVRKVEVIQRELGSLGTVVLDRIEASLKDGIRARSLEDIEGAEESAGATGDRQATAQRELEDATRAAKALKREIDTAARELERSRERAGVHPESLAAAVQVGCRLAGGASFERVEVEVKGGKAIEAWRIPTEGLTGWQRAIDTLRPPRKRDQELWDWRKIDPLPVVFRPPPHMNDPVVHLHLEHPFVKRALSRFRSQGYGQSDLSRVTAVLTPDFHEVRVVAFARLSLFGEGARRLHDELIAVAAPWLEAGGDDHLQPLDKADTRETLAVLDRALIAAVRDPDRFPETHAERLAPGASADYMALWPALDAEADAHAREAEVKLDERGHKDSDALRRILERQMGAIDQQIGQMELNLRDIDYDPRERHQVQRDREHMVDRRRRLDVEVVEEPEAIRALFEVTLRRVTPVGMVYLWPETHR